MQSIQRRRRRVAISKDAKNVFLSKMGYKQTSREARPGDLGEMGMAPHEAAI